MPYTIKPGSFKYKKSNGQFSEIDCFEGPDLTEEVAVLEKGKAPIIIDSATGNPIVIKDGADSLPVEGMKIHFSPVQSGTGDPSPSNVRSISGWTEINAYRAGKNLFDPAKTDRTSTIYNIRVYKNDPILLPAGTYTMSCSEECNGLYVEQGSSDIFTKYNSTFLTFTLNEATKVSFNFYTVNAFASDAVVQLEVGSVATPYTPYTGISYPVTLPVLGKNLLPNKKCISGDNIFFGTDEAKSPYINVHSITLSSGTYTLSVETQDTSVTNLYVAEVGNSATIALQYNTKTLTFTISKTTDLRIWAYKNGYGQIGTGAITTFQLETGDTATTYEPFNTIYGGTLDAVNGVLTVEWEAFSAKLSDATIKTEYDGINMYRFDNAFAHNVLNNSNQKCDISGYEFGTEAVLTNHFYVFNKTIRLYMLTPVDETKEFTIVCPIAEPYEIQLDPVTVTTLLGNNTIWSDANGDIELDYRADTKLFVDNNNPVTDIRVKDTSLVQNGIVNMPLAQASTPGLMMVGAGYGLKAADINGNSAGRIQTDQAWPDLIKGFADQYRPITPKYLPDAVFQGLARAAGDTTQSASSNAIGTFTPEAIVAIQKMLGIYEAPWELIREDTVTNAAEASINITVDNNGLPFELTDIRLIFWTPQQESASGKGDYGKVNHYYDAYGSVDTNYVGAWTQSEGSAGKWAGSFIEQKNGLLIKTYLRNAPLSNYSDICYSGYVNTGAGNMMILENRTYNKIEITAVTGTMRYRLYGRRKWTT